MTDRIADQVYTLAEAAEHLRLTTRAVAKIAKKHGLCMVTGRTILFTEGDIEGIKNALRSLPSAPPSAQPARLSADQLSEKLRARTSKSSRKAAALERKRASKPSSDPSP